MRTNLLFAAKIWLITGKIFEILQGRVCELSLSVKSLKKIYKGRGVSVVGKIFGILQGRCVLVGNSRQNGCKLAQMWKNQGGADSWIR